LWYILYGQYWEVAMAARAANKRKSVKRKLAEIGKFATDAAANYKPNAYIRALREQNKQAR
tara:strand:- start:330467 stop:330649 length:183 start_codon:yes stop_codon:yes gene_type:complete